MNVHLIGIGGIGMSGIAQLLLHRGEKVSGSDLTESDLIQRIRAMGGKVQVGHSASGLNHPDLVVYSSSIAPDNPELVAAKNQGIRVFHRGEILAELLRDRRTIAITGAHGKSTTAGLTGQLLLQAGLDPTVVLGAQVESLGGNARHGQGSYAVIEADESDGSLLWLTPLIAVVTNIDEEHLDYFRNLGEILECYQDFAQRISNGGYLVGCGDDPLVSRLMQTVPHKRITYGLSTSSRIRAEKIELGAGFSRFRCLRSGKILGNVQLQIPGIHNVVNSLAVVGIADALGIGFSVTRAALEGYQGAKRRFQIHAEVKGILVVEDYGHHPAEIQATLQAARDFGRRRIHCIFQPHRYSRTHFLLSRFGSSFHLADEVTLLPIYAASEDPVDGVTSQRFLKAIQAAGQGNVRLESAEEVLDRLAAEAQAGDLILFLGAGNVGSLAPRLVEILKGSGRPGTDLRQGLLRQGLLAVTHGRVRFNEPMRLHTTFHLGGPAEIWAEPHSVGELRGLLRIAREENLKVTLIGGGANLLIRDEGIPGLTLHLGHRGFQRITRTDDSLVVGAGLPLVWLIRRCLEEGLTGLEFLTGVPGRVGGAIWMNAGTHDDEGKSHAMADVIRSVTVMDEKGDIRTVPREAIQFQYRSAGLKDKIVLGSTLTLSPDDPSAIRKRIDRLWAFKRRTQDWTSPSAGCIFKNPASGPAAGWMIDQAGLKGRQIGGAIVSPIHANFIVNRGDACAADVLNLIEEARARVSRQFGLGLELEVQVLP